MIRYGAPTSTPAPAGCIVGPNGEWIYDTTPAHVDAAADSFGVGVSEVGGFYACTRVLPLGQVIVLRAPLPGGVA